ncbi:MAG: hypothetical protein ACJ8DI_14900 [Ktedonobacteraceae bacterium]
MSAGGIYASAARLRIRYLVRPLGSGRIGGLSLLHDCSFLACMVLLVILLGACNPSVYEIGRANAAERQQAIRTPLNTKIRPPMAINAVSEVGNTEQAPIWRFIEPLDPHPVRMSDDEIKAELNDPWWTKVLAPSGAQIPTLLSEVISKVGTALPQFTQQNYLVAEGGHIPVSSQIPRSSERNLRYALLWKESSIVHILASASPPSDSSNFLQIISWDASKNKFNFYERFSSENGTPFWAWAGDSTYARRSQTRGQGCFDCHHNGVPIMKELFRPWNNWDSELASIAPAVVPESVVNDAPFRRLTSASELELEVKAAGNRYFNAWLNKHVSSDVKTVTGVPDLLERLIGNTTVNFGSSLQKSENPGGAVSFPNDFFVYDSFFRSLNVGLTYDFPPSIKFSPEVYAKFLTDHKFKLVQCALADNKQGCSDTESYHVPGSTFFAGFVPVPSIDDTTVLQALLFSSGIGDPKRSVELLSKKFIVSVLMVDFPNPVFSAVRSSLQKYANALNSASITNGKSNIPELFAAKVQAVGMPPCKNNPIDACSAEQQFLYYWEDDAWQSKAETAIGDYLKAVATRIQQPSGAQDYLRLSVSRHLEFASTPIIQNLFEFSLLSPQNDIPASFLRMKTDGSVVAVNP